MHLWLEKYLENEKAETKIFSSRIEDFQVQWVKYHNSDIMLRYNPNFSKNVRLFYLSLIYSFRKGSLNLAVIQRRHRSLTFSRNSIRKPSILTRQVTWKTF